MRAKPKRQEPAGTPVIKITVTGGKGAGKSTVMTMIANALRVHRIGATQYPRRGSTIVPSEPCVQRTACYAHVRQKVEVKIYEQHSWQDGRHRMEVQQLLTAAKEAISNSLTPEDAENLRYLECLERAGIGAELRKRANDMFNKEMK